MDRDPAERTLVDLMVGYQVIVEHMAGPKLTDDNVDKVVGEGEVLASQPEARTATFWLRAYNNFGIEVTPTEEYSNHIFLPWGAVLKIHGQDRLELEQAEREAMGQNQQRDTEDIASSPDRQEAMDLLANAETPSEAAEAKAAADGWLLTHPSDGDVRMAREQLEDHFPEDPDPEEASPT